MPRFNDLTGKKFERLTVISKAGHKGKSIVWECLCDCGNTTIVSGTHLTTGHTKSCGCLKSVQRSNMIDLTGQRFGRLTVLEKDKTHITSGGAFITMWKCRCDCGKITGVSSSALRRDNTHSCGCYRDEKIAKVGFEDLTGKKYGRLTVVRFLTEEERKTRGFTWLCQCECGNFIHSHPYHLKSGHTKSCGCLRKETSREINRKYKNIDKRLYTVYKGILSRCYDEKHREYHNYGGRGVTVCDEWLGDYGFDKFSEWAYSSGYKTDAKYHQCTIDRIDVNKNYCPENCRWITNKEQQNNRRNCRFIEHNGEVKTIAQWAEYFNIPYGKAYWHLGKYNRTVQELIDNYL